MSTFFKLSMLGVVFFVSGCANLIGLTGADTGKRVGDWVKYNAITQG